MNIDVSHFGNMESVVNYCEIYGNTSRVLLEVMVQQVVVDHETTSTLRLQTQNFLGTPIGIPSALTKQTK